MKRFILTIAFCLTYVGLASAAPYLAITPMQSATDDTVSFLTASTATTYTKAIKSRIENPTDKIGVIYKGTGSTVDFRIELEQSFRPQTTEGAADLAYQLAYDVDTSVTTSGTWKVATVDTVVMPYIRFKIVGQGSNAAGTIAEIKVSK